MAKHVLYNASVVANGVDLSDHDNMIEIQVGIGSGSAAAMGDAQDYDLLTTKHIKVKGKFFQDYASGKVHATFKPLFDNRTSFNLVVKADSGATSTTNEQWTIPVGIGNMTLISGSRGDVHMVDVDFTTTGTYSTATS